MDLLPQGVLGSPARTRILVLIPAGLILLNFALSVGVASGPLQRFPASGDEYAYLLSAEIFSRGRLSVPSPIPSEFFNQVHVVNDGRYYGKYPPGWPLLLTLGVLAGSAWMTNCVIGAATLFVIYRIGRRYFSPSTAMLSLVLAAANPYLIFNNASYFSHPSCLFAISLFYYSYFACLDQSGRWIDWVGMGLFGGCVFLIRPFTAVSVLMVPLLYLLGTSIRGDGWKSLPSRLGLSLAAASFCVAAFLIYNRLQTGDAFLQPFNHYDPKDLPQLSIPMEMVTDRIRTHIFQRFLDLCRWAPAVPVLAGIAALGYRLRTSASGARIIVLSSGLVSLMAAYFFYFGNHPFEYGPRYLFESSAAMLILAALAVERLGRYGSLVLGAVVVLSGVVLIQESRKAAIDVAGQRDVYERVEEAKLSNAIVFLRTGSGKSPVVDCLRNGLDFNGPVLLVQDLGPRNKILLREFPERTAYFYQYDPIAKRGLVVPASQESIGR